jgi:hypothetical protein
LDERARLLEIALTAASRRWPVLPLQRNASTPVGLQGGETDAGATTDPDRIRLLWADEPFNVGVATGLANLVVLSFRGAPDQSGCDGWTYFEAWCRQHHGDLDRLPARPRHTELFDGSAPVTRTVRTGAGRQLYFTAPAGARVESSVEMFAPLVDVHATAGFVAAAGSTVDGFRYEVEGPALMYPLPSWLQRLIVPSAQNEFKFPSQYALRPENYPR